MSQELPSHQHLCHPSSVIFMEWSPFFMGIGIGLYFSRKSPLPLPFTLSLTVFWVGLCILSTLNRFPLKRFFWWKALLVSLLGFLTPEAHLLFHRHQKNWFVKWPISRAFLRGTVQTISFATDPPFMVLAPPHLSITFHTASPKAWHFIVPKGEFRIRLRKTDLLPNPGDFLEIPARLFPVPHKETPSGFEAKRWAYFSNLLGRGISLGPPAVLSHKASFLQNVRASVQRQLHRLLPLDTGTIAAALLIGDRSGIKTDTRKAFTDAGIAHVLAISGLHLSLVTGIFFFLIRRFLCLIPVLGQTYDTKKIAVPFAFLTGAFYLALSGAALATQRAFLMLTAVLLSILIDRPSSSKRSLMGAALLILILQPTALFMPSFSLSFFAVLGLVTGYESFKEDLILLKSKTLFTKVLLYIKGLLLSSFFASLATLPFTLYHFQKATLHALTSNLLVIPLMAFWIMPCALLGALTWPLNGESFFFPLMGKGIHQMTTVAETISKWPGANIQIPGSPPFSLGLMMVGSFSVMMGKNFVRLAGALCLLVSLVLPFFQDKPTLFFSSEGTSVGIFQNGTLTVSSRALDSRLPRLWLEYLGLPPTVLRPWPKNKEGTFQPIETLCGPIIFEQTKTSTSSNKFSRFLIRESSTPQPKLIITNRDTKALGAHFITCSAAGLTVETSVSSSTSWPWDKKHR